jgi:hypothetical protein
MIEGVHADDRRYLLKRISIKFIKRLHIEVNAKRIIHSITVSDLLHCILVNREEKQVNHGSISYPKIRSKPTLMFHAVCTG